MSHIIRSSAGKKINTISKLFIKQKIVFNFVYFSSFTTLEQNVFHKGRNYSRVDKLRGTRNISYATDGKTFVVVQGNGLKPNFYKKQSSSSSFLLT